MAFNSSKIYFDYTNLESYLIDNFKSRIGDSIINFYTIQQQTNLNVRESLRDVREELKKVKKATQKPINKEDRKKQKNEGKKKVQNTIISYSLQSGAFGGHSCKNKNYACGLINCPCCGGDFIKKF